VNNAVRTSFPTLTLNLPLLISLTPNPISSKLTLTLLLSLSLPFLLRPQRLGIKFQLRFTPRGLKLIKKFLNRSGVAAQVYPRVNGNAYGAGLCDGPSDAV
jgi:hypothetical protein